VTRTATSPTTADTHPHRPGDPFARVAGHEQVTFCHHDSGLRAIIAIHRTSLGPALGGTRFHPYPDYDSALTDVLRLSRAMSYKNALAGLDHGGGKAVIIGDPARDKSPELLRAYGRFVESLAGRYVTACDVGTTSADMDLVGTESAHVTGRTTEHGGAGDSGVLTAFGVVAALRAAAEQAWGTDDLDGRRIGVQGAGKVGARLVDLLLARGAGVLVYDPDRAATDRLRRAHPAVTVVASGAELLATPLDVFMPCAMGGAIDQRVAATISTRIICGGANNQLTTPSVEATLAARGILYTPDYLANAGGVIQVSGELSGFDFDRAQARAAGIHDTAARVFGTATELGLLPGAAADLLAEQRMDTVTGLDALHLPAAPAGARTPPGRLDG
jgi:valine dehydrogenase (NAD+)